MSPPETAEQPQSLEQALRQHFRLVGADGELQSGILQAVERGHEPGVGDRFTRHGAVVEFDELLHLPGQLFLTQRLAAQREGALDHGPRAVADQMGEIGVSNRFDTGLRHDMVEARDEVGSGIDEGTVEIEDD